MASGFNPNNPFVSELKYYETDEFRTLEQLRLKAIALYEDYTAGSPLM